VLVVVGLVRIDLLGVSLYIVCQDPSDHEQEYDSSHLEVMTRWPSSYHPIYGKKNFKSLTVAHRLIPWLPGEEVEDCKVKSQNLAF